VVFVADKPEDLSAEEAAKALKEGLSKPLGEPAPDPFGPDAAAKVELDFARTALRARAVAWINEKWTVDDKRCPICGTTKWDLGDVGVVPLGTSDGGLDMGEGQPSFPLTCTNCGFTRHFSAVVADLVDRTTGKFTEEESS
jgi:hypothetical protein